MTRHSSIRQRAYCLYEPLCVFLNYVHWRKTCHTQCRKMLFLICGISYGPSHNQMWKNTWDIRKKHRSCHYGFSHDFVRRLELGKYMSHSEKAMGIYAVWVLLYDLIMLDVKNDFLHSEHVVLLAAVWTSLCVYRRSVQEVQWCSFLVNCQCITEKY